MQMLQVMRIGVFVVILISGAQPCMPHDDVRGFEICAGAVISSGYKDTLNDAYYDHDVSGGLGWVDIGFAYRHPLSAGFSIVPRVGFLFNYVEESRDMMSFNTVVLPSVNGRFQFDPNAGFFVQGGINLGIVNMGAGRLEDIVSDGVGLQLFLGFQTDGSLFLMGGYQQIPVKVDGFRWDEDFGGLTARIGAIF